MPDDEEEKDEIESVSAEHVLPQVVPPTTKTPFQFNQQVNIHQIPTRAWEKLSADQIVELSKDIIKQIEKSDERQFNWAVEQAKNSGTTQRMAMCIGGVIAVCGFAVVTYLAVIGHTVVAGMIGTFIATIIAVTIGNRMFQ
jgi:hypothetical protein